MARLSDWERSVTEPEMARLALVLDADCAKEFAAGLARDLDINVKVSANGDIWIEPVDMKLGNAYLLGYLARGRSH